MGGKGSGGGAGEGGAGFGGDGLSGIGAPVRKSLLLQQSAVNLIKANKAADEVPILLIGERAFARGPGKLARRLWMIGIVNEIVIISGIRR